MCSVTLWSCLSPSSSYQHFLASLRHLVFVSLFSFGYQVSVSYPGPSREGHCSVDLCLERCNTFSASIAYCTYLHGLLSFCNGFAYSASRLSLRSAFSHFVGVDSAPRLASSNLGFLLSSSIRRGSYGVLTAFPTVQTLGGDRTENGLIHFLSDTVWLKDRQSVHLSVHTHFLDIHSILHLKLILNVSILSIV